MGKYVVEISDLENVGHGELLEVVDNALKIHGAEFDHIKVSYQED